MTLKVALFQCPAWTVDTPPLGLASIASVTAASGFEALCRDLNIALYRRLEAHHARYWSQGASVNWTDRGWVSRLLQSQTDFIEETISEVLAAGIAVAGFSINRASLPSSIWVAERIKARAPDCRIVLGGSYTHILANAFALMQYPVVDYVIAGEGEETFPELLRAIENGDPRKVLGLIGRERGKLRFAGPRPFIENLDRLPPPDFAAFPLAAYRERKLPLIIGRGCRGRCAFCSDRKIWGPYRRRSPELVAAELAEYQRRFAVRRFDLNDSAINASQAEFSALLDAIIAQRLDILWGGFIKPVAYLDRELLGKMKQAGCDWMTLGVESGSQVVLNAMRKGFHRRGVARILRDAHKLGIKTYLNFMTGFPQERRRDFLQTIAFIIRNRRHIDNVVSISHCGIMPGTEIAEHPERFAVEYEAHGAEETEGYRYWISQNGRNTYLKRKQRLQLLTLVVRLLGFHPDYVEQAPEEERLDRARYLVDTSRFEMAEKSLARMLRQNPRHEEARVLLAQALIKAGKAERAVSVMTVGLELLPSAYGRRWLAEALGAAGKHEAAAAILAQAIAEGGETWELWKRRADELFQAEKWAEAADAAERAYRMEPDDRNLLEFAFECWWRAGKSARHEGKLGEASTLLRHGLDFAGPALGAAASGMYKELGECLMESGELPAAKRFIAYSLRLSPGEAWAWFSLGECLKIEGKRLSARKCYQRCLALMPDHPEAASKLR